MEVEQSSKDLYWGVKGLTQWITDLSREVAKVYMGEAKQSDVIKWVIHNYDLPQYWSPLRDVTPVTFLISSLLDLEENIKNIPIGSSGSAWSSIFDFNTEFEDEEINELLDEVAIMVEGIKLNYPTKKP